MSEPSPKSKPDAARLVVRLEPLGTKVTLAPTERLLDALDDELAERLTSARSDASPAALPTACRAANCGACLVWVVSGAEAFTPASAAERELLHRLAPNSSARLGCQLHAGPQPGSRAVLRVAAVEAQKRP